MTVETTPTHTAKVLLVDDSEADVDLIKIALKNSRTVVKMNHCCNGIEALAYLEEIQAAADFPDIVLLDINMPGINGIEVLKILKSDKRWKHIPVAMLTSSDREADIYNSYYEHANCFIKKPLDFQQFQQVIEYIEHFWLNIVTLPQKNDM